MEYIYKIEFEFKGKKETFTVSCSTHEDIDKVICKRIFEHLKLRPLLIRQGDNIHKSYEDIIRINNIQYKKYILDI